MDDAREGKGFATLARARAPILMIGTSWVPRLAPNHAPAAASLPQGQFRMKSPPAAILVGPTLSNLEPTQVLPAATELSQVVQPARSAQLGQSPGRPPLLTQHCGCWDPRDFRLAPHSLQASTYGVRSKGQPGLRETAREGVSQGRPAGRPVQVQSGHR